jgi:HK97 family phage portal protein
LGLLAAALTALTGRSSSFSYGAGTGFANFGSEPTYEQCARAFMSNEIVNRAVRLLATSAAEPCIEGRRWRRERPQYQAARKIANVRHAGPIQALRRDYLVRNGFYEDLPNHPLVKLLNRPNPYMKTRAEMMQLLVMDRLIAGNAFILKARNPDFGNVAELWRLRPDRVRIITNSDGYPVACQYTVGETRTLFPYEDVIHWKELHPLSDYLGLSPMSSILPRVASDESMREMLRQFYGSGGSGPGSILTLSGSLSEEAKTETRAKLRSLLNHPGAFRETLILENGTSTYQRLGLDRGLTDAVPKDVNAVMESRIAMPFGIPASILGLLVGMESSSYANKRSDWQVLWDITMTPMMSSFDDGFTAGLCPEFAGIDEVQFELSDIRALQEDVDALHKRHRDDYMAGLESWEEARGGIGLDPDTSDGLYLIPTTGELTPFDRLTAVDPAPVQVAAPQIPAANLIASEFSAAFQQLDRAKGGRPPLLADPGARAIYDRAMSLRAKNPTWSWLEVADKLGISERQLRRYRTEFAE